MINQFLIKENSSDSNKRGKFCGREHGVMIVSSFKTISGTQKPQGRDFGRVVLARGLNKMPAKIFF